MRDGDTELSKGMGEVPGVTPDHTSFNHVRVCNHSVHIFGCIGDRSCCCANCTRTKTEERRELTVKSDYFCCHCQNLEVFVQVDTCC